MLGRLIAAPKSARSLRDTEGASSTYRVDGGPTRQAARDADGVPVPSSWGGMSMGKQNNARARTFTQSGPVGVAVVGARTLLQTRQNSFHPSRLPCAANNSPDYAARASATLNISGHLTRSRISGWICNRATPTPGRIPTEFRQDACGHVIRLSAYGDTDGPEGWEVDHIQLIADGRIDVFPNRRPLQVRANRHRGALLAQGIHVDCP